MTTQGWILAFCFSLASVFGTVELFETKETHIYTCRTFGSGVVQPFKGETYYVRSDCPFTLTSFTVNRGGGGHAHANWTVSAFGRRRT
uniref:Spiggin/ChrI n=1 Tax=Pungitius pungitius TaxID=134920 RepID=A0A0H5BLN8_9TELE|nr:Spiggin/ChrI [Pungitius pungitius]